MTSITVEHPDYQPGRGEKQLDRGVVLHDEAANAFQVWATIYGNRNAGIDAYDRVNRDGLAKVVESGGVLGELVKLAVADAETQPLSGTIGHRAQRYAIANALIAQRAELTATPPAAQPADDTCSHGVPFTSDCAECEW